MSYDIRLFACNTFISKCYHHFLLSFVTEQQGRQKRSMEVKYYLTLDEYTNMREIALRMYADGVIPKANVNAFAKAAGYKFYNEYNEHLRRSLKANHK
jgi:hypothetical protein